jgi:hypothetical protein
MECFDQKSRDQLSMWLLDEGFTEPVVEAFKGACRGPAYYFNIAWRHRRYGRKCHVSSLLNL